MLPLIMRLKRYSKELSVCYVGLVMINLAIDEVYTINVERFAGLNIHGFSLMKIFARIFLYCLD